MMSCLLPQFKCFPDTFAANFKSQAHNFVQSSKSRDSVNFRPQCSLSTASSSSSATAVLELEKPQLPSLEAIPCSLAAAERSWKTLPSSPTDKTPMLNLHKLPSFDDHSTLNPWPYSGTVASPSEKQASLGSDSDKETLLTGDEAVIAAAASEALALAKAALKLANDAAATVSHKKSPENSILGKKNLHSNLFQGAYSREPATASQFGLGEYNNHSNSVCITENEDTEPTMEELELLGTQLSKSIAVRSNRQMERKARRTKASERALSSNIVTVKSGSLRRKNRSNTQEVDYSDPLRYLRSTTTSSRLLTASEEQVLSEGIQVLLKLEKLQEELKERCGDGEPSFAQWAAAAGIDQRTLRKQINYGSLCKDKMIKSNIRLVISIAKNYQGAGMNLQDLVQEGCRGLVRGAEKFDASKGFKFSTYAHWWIKQAVRKSLSDQSRTIRLPFHMVEATYRVKEAKKQLYSENGRVPNDEEVAEATGLSMKRLSAVLLTPKAPRSLDQKIGANQDLKPSDVIADPEAETSEELLIKQFMRQDLAKVLDSLNPREKQVVKWRFGLEDGRMKTLQEIGELMGVSRERVRQIESCAFRKLKNKKRTKHLQQYVMPG